MITIMQYFLLFLFYSFIGWIIDIIGAFYDTKRIINRGFLIGPYCPIYGVGSTIIILLLKQYRNDYLVLFIMSFTICSIVEYLTSYLMERLFKLRWWDYSNNPFNLNGRICLFISLGFAFGGLIINLINQHILNLISFIPITFLLITFWSTLTIFIIDIIMSFNIVSKLKISEYGLPKDYTAEISEKVKRKLAEKSYRLKRLFKAFPNIKLPTTKIKKNN